MTDAVVIMNARMKCMVGCSLRTIVMIQTDEDGSALVPHFPDERVVKGRDMRCLEGAHSFVVI